MARRLTTVDILWGDSMGTVYEMEQMSVFDYDKKPLKIDKPIRLIELFAGIGSQAKALERLGVDFEHYRVCEFDKYAIKSYNAVHGTDFVTMRYIIQTLKRVILQN